MSMRPPDDDEEDELSSADEDNADLRGPRDAGARDEDFDEFEDSTAQYSGPDSGGGRGGTHQVQNQPFDEAMELSDSDGNSAQPSPVPRGAASGAGGAGRGASSSRRADTVTNQPFDEAMELSSEGSVDGGDDDDGDKSAPSLSPAPEQPSSVKAQMGSSTGMGGMGSRQAAPEMPSQLDSMPARGMPKAPAGDKDDDDDNDYPDGADGSAAGAPVPEGMYDPEEYANLPVSAEIKELFQYITRYKPHNIELETKMRPFIPDYIPAVGDIDPFIKVPRPDGKVDNLGLVTLDEPASVQSDPTVLTLQLRATTKSSGAQPMLVRSVEHAEKNPKAITSWIHSISDLHRHKPAPSVRYSKPMPDIEALMQIWPAPMEELLESHPLPPADVSLDLASYVRMVCAMLDIPIYGSLTEALHVLFTLYSDFKANVHFQQQISAEQMQQQQMGGSDGMGGGGLGDSYAAPSYGGADTLTLS